MPRGDAVSDDRDRLGDLTRLAHHFTRGQFAADQRACEFRPIRFAEKSENAYPFDKPLLKRRSGRSGSLLHRSG